MVRSAVLGNNDIAKLIFWSLTIPDLCRVERVSAWLRVAASTDETFRLALESLLAPAVASLEDGAKHEKHKADTMDPVEEDNDYQPPVMCGHTLSEARTFCLLGRERLEQRLGGVLRFARVVEQDVLAVLARREGS